MTKKEILQIILLGIGGGIVNAIVMVLFNHNYNVGFLLGGIYGSILTILIIKKYL